MRPILMLGLALACCLGCGPRTLEEAIAEVKLELAAAGGHPFAMTSSYADHLRFQGLNEAFHGTDVPGITDVVGVVATWDGAHAQLSFPTETPSAAELADPDVFFHPLQHDADGEPYVKVDLDPVPVGTRVSMTWGSKDGSHTVTQTFTKRAER